MVLAASLASLVGLAIAALTGLAECATRLPFTATLYTFEAEVTKSDRPVVFLSCPATKWCKADEAAVAAQVPRHPELKFVSGYFPNTTGRSLRFHIPGGGFIFELSSFEASKLTDAFWKQRSDFATREAAAYKAALAAQNAQPFSPDDEVKSWHALETIEDEDRATAAQWR
jgi:hypothetical protein